MKILAPDILAPKMAARLHMLFRREDGSATVEAVIWMPVLFAAFALIADTSMIFGSEAQTMRIVQDANRAFSIGRFTTSTEVENAVESRIASFSPGAEATSTVVDGMISTVVVLPLSDITATGLVSAFLDKSVTVYAQHLTEG